MKHRLRRSWNMLRYNMNRPIIFEWDKYSKY